MTYYSDYNHGAIVDGSHLTGELEFYTITTLIPLVGEDANVNSENPNVNSENPGAADNLRRLTEILAQHGQPVIQSVSVTKNVTLAKASFGTDFTGNKNVYTYKYSVEQPCVWGVDDKTTIANLIAALDNIPTVYVPNGQEGKLDKIYTTDAIKKNTLVSYSKVL